MLAGAWLLVIAMLYFGLIGWLKALGIFFILGLVGWIMALVEQEEEHDVTFYDKNGNKTGSKKYKKNY